MGLYLKLFTLLLFLTCYFLIILRKGNPLTIIWVGAAILLLTRTVSPWEAASCINLNVLGVFWGTMVLSELFIYSQVPAYLATHLVSRSSTVGIALLAVCGLAGFISTFVENVATVLIVAPIALEVASKLEISPVPLLIGIAVSSNLQGCATMIGDSPSIILAVATRMTFNDFFWMKGKPGIFFAVELGALASFIILYLIYKKYRQPVVEVKEVEVRTWIPTILMSLNMLALAISSFFPNRPYYTMAIICVFFGSIALVWHEIARKESLSLLKDLDWQTFFFLMGLFILIGSLSVVNLTTDIANIILKFTGGNPFVAYTIIVWLSVLLSAFIDNIPYIIAMIPVTQLVSNSLGLSPYLLPFGLLIGTSLGGNITPIGASANVVAVGMLRKRGHQVSFSEFCKIGFPFTISAVSVGYLFLWVVWR